MRSSHWVIPTIVASIDVKIRNAFAVVPNLGSVPNSSGDMFRLWIASLWFGTAWFGLAWMNSASRQPQQPVPANAPDPAPILADALNLYRKGSFDQALGKYNDILKADSHSGEAYAGMIRCYLKQDKVREADDAPAVIEFGGADNSTNHGVETRAVAAAVANAHGANRRRHWSKRSRR